MRIRIRRNHMFLSLADPDPDPFVRDTDLSSSKNSMKNIDSYSFVTSLWLFIIEKWCKCTFKKVISKKNSDKNNFCCWFLEGHWRKWQDPDPNPNPLVRRMDPRIRIPTKNFMDPHNTAFQSQYCWVVLPMTVVPNCRRVCVECGTMYHTACLPPSTAPTPTSNSNKKEVSTTADWTCRSCLKCSSCGTAAVKEHPQVQCILHGPNNYKDTKP